MRTRRFTSLWMLGIFSGITLIVLAGFLNATPAAEAYPEFAERTGETCAACHFNPAGAGPRTPRGELWVIDGQPDHVPELPGAETAPPEIQEPLPELEEGEQADILAGAGLYEMFTCDNCHGVLGEGVAENPALNQEMLSVEVITTTVRTGPGEMPALPEAVLSDEQMELLVIYVQNLATGRVVRVEELDAPGPLFAESIQSEETEEGP